MRGLRFIESHLLPTYHSGEGRNPENPPTRGKHVPTRYNATTMTTEHIPTNTLYYGDNLAVLREHVPDESVDLVYLDPPFNSNASYNVLFKERTGEESPAQIKAFTDTWEWTQEAERTYEQDIIVNAATPAAVKEMISAFRQFIGNNAMMAYLVMMAPRLVELQRVLKPTGSIYLHCDPTASHYLKILMDTVFGKQNFRNEVVWRRYSSHGNVSRNLGKVHDILFLYGKSARFTWNQQYRPLRDEYVEKFFRKVESGTGRRYQSQNVLNPNDDRPNLTYEWNGHTRVWKWSRERMQQLHDKGRLEYSRTGYPRLKQYLDESQGERLQDIWDDINPIG